MQLPLSCSSVDSPTSEGFAADNQVTLEKQGDSRYARLEARSFLSPITTTSCQYFAGESELRSLLPTSLSYSFSFLEYLAKEDNKKSALFRHGIPSAWWNQRYVCSRRVFTYSSYSTFRIQSSSFYSVVRHCIRALLLLPSSVELLALAMRAKVGSGNSLGRIALEKIAEVLIGTQGIQRDLRARMTLVIHLIDR
jgi:hypothetical protein